MELIKILASLSVLYSTAASYPARSFKKKCEALAQGIPHDGYTTLEFPVSVNFAHYLPANSSIDHTAEHLNSTCLYTISPPQLPASICRLQLKITTSSKSSTIAELWLPETWSGRFLSVGNGGFGGCIQYMDLAYGTSYNFATVGADNGHEGSSGGAWYNSPDVLEDFVYRSLYSGVSVGKQITTDFYGKKHSKSYYFGCSTGGRQGWKAVQAFPDLFDGVIAGAPAFNFNGLIVSAAWAQKHVVDPNNPGYLSRENWTMVAEAVMKQCDVIDGASDSIIENTQLCKPDYSNLGLSSEQVRVVESAFKELAINGTSMSPGSAPGYEAGLFDFLSSTTSQDWANEWFQYVVKSDLSWNYTLFTDADALEAYKLNPFNIATYDGDISAFRDRGGKILHWHGQADTIIPVKNSDQYYDIVSKTLSASPSELDSFYRYFRVSGTGHCSGGPGAGNIGQGWGLNASNDAEDNVLLRIVKWVEQGEAPDVVRGAKFVEDDPTKGIAFSRKHCKYPKVNKYCGGGDGMDEDGWHCVDA